VATVDPIVVRVADLARRRRTVVLSFGTRLLTELEKATKRPSPDIDA